MNPFCTVCGVPIVEHPYTDACAIEDEQVRYGFGDGGHPFNPDSRGRCKSRDGGYCDGTREDTAHERRVVA